MSALRKCCEAKALEVFSWNACGASMNDVSCMLDGLDIFGWDLVRIQEGQKNCQQHCTLSEKGHVILSAEGSGRGGAHGACEQDAC